MPSTGASRCTALLRGRTVGLVGMGQFVFDNLDAWFAGRPPLTPVARARG